jgi:hypothetical protein
MSELGLLEDFKELLAKFNETLLTDLPQLSESLDELSRNVEGNSPETSKST